MDSLVSFSVPYLHSTALLMPPVSKLNALTTSRANMANAVSAIAISTVCLNFARSIAQCGLSSPLTESLGMILVWILGEMMTLVNTMRCQLNSTQQVVAM